MAIKNIRTTSKKFGVIYWQPSLKKFDYAYIKDVLSFYSDKPDLFRIEAAIKTSESNTLNDIKYIALTGDVEVIDRNQYLGYSDGKHFTIRGKNFKEIQCNVYRIGGDYERPPTCRFQYDVYKYMTEAANNFLAKEFQEQLLKATTEKLLNSLIAEQKKGLVKKVKEKISNIREQLNLIENYQE